MFFGGMPGGMPRGTRVKRVAAAKRWWEIQMRVPIEELGYASRYTMFTATKY